MTTYQELESALEEAKQLSDDGWTTDDCGNTRVYKVGGNGDMKEVSPLVHRLMRAITFGIGLKSKWDRESENSR